MRYGFACLIALLLIGPPLGAGEDIAPIKSVEIGRRAEFRVNGKPFFPLMLWLQGLAHFEAARSAGINTVAGYAGRSDGIVAYAQKLGKAGMYFVASYHADLSEADARKLAAGDYLLGWIHGDEPDLARRVKVAEVVAGKGMTVSSEYRPRRSEKDVAATRERIRAVDKTRPVFVTFTASFMASQRRRYTAAQQKRIYTTYSRYADVVGFDTYPIFGSAMFKNLADPGIGIGELRALAGAGKPLYAWIETNRGSKWMTPSRQPAVEPKHTRFETWAAVIRGATAIGYFTHKWFDPDGKANYSQFAPKEDPSMMAELKRLNAQLTKLAPAILAAPAEAKIGMKQAGGLACHFKATRHDGAVWIFAQNMDLGPGAEKLKQFQPIKPRTAEATFTVAGLARGAKIEVVDEGRTLSAGDNAFTDEFAPLGEHVYRIPRAGFPAGGG